VNAAIDAMRLVLSGTMTPSRNLEKELGIKRSEWKQAEISVNRAEGTVNMANRIFVKDSETVGLWTLD
jgi:hypothetical protein